jgi:hypothetical protein
MALFRRIEITIERRLSGKKQTLSDPTFHNIRYAKISGRGLGEVARISLWRNLAACLVNPRARSKRLLSSLRRVSGSNDEAMADASFGE